MLYYDKSPFYWMKSSEGGLYCTKNRILEFQQNPLYIYQSLFSSKRRSSFFYGFAISGERKSGYSSVKPALLIDHIYRHITLSGYDLEPCFLYCIGKKKFSIQSDDCFIVFLFFLLTSLVHDFRQRSEHQQPDIFLKIKKWLQIIHFRYTPYNS